MTDRIAIGILRKAHGVRGEASVELWTDSPDRFEDLETVTLVSPDESQTFEARVESARAHAGRALVKFSGIDSPEELRRFQGWTVEIPESEARELEEDEYFLHDLPGLTLVDAEGKIRGTVEDTYEGGGGILLAVRRPDGKSFELPFAADICTKIDLAARRIDVAIPEGLDDLSSIADDASLEKGIAARPSESGLQSAASGLESGSREPSKPRLRVDFVTIFPKMFEPLLAEGVIARGIKAGLLDVRVWDLRDYATDRHRSTDDEAYGGGPGMVMLAEPVLRCVEAIRAESTTETPHVVLTSPQGRRFSQPVAGELAGRGWVVFLCGRYEGFDHRVHEILQPDQISVGDFVVSGGELPAMLMADAMGRLIEGVVGNSGSVEEDSFFRGLLDYPHYTRPEELRGHRVPDILLSGHHENIRRWRKEQALRATWALRRDLLTSAELDDEARKILGRIENEI